jgi:microcystin-dependent protein
MPLTFPSSPSNGEIYVVGSRTWTWNGSIWEINGTAAGVASVGETELTSDAVTTAKIANSAITTAKIANSSVTVAKIESNPTFTGTVTLPANTSIGNVSSTEISYVDGVTSAIQTQLNDKAPIASRIPVGVISAYAGSSAPSGWLLCFGQAVSRSTYSDLFAALSTTYGAGDGSTTFNLPDLRGRVAAGVDNMGGSAASRLTSTVLSASNTLGASGGAQTHTLDSTQIPAHSHPNTLGSNIVASNGHTHTAGSLMAGLNFFNAGGVNYADHYSVSSGGTYSENQRAQFPAGGAVSGLSESNTVGIGVVGSTSGNSGSTTVSITNANNTGGGSAHTNTQPTLVLNYIIKATL